MTIIIKKIAILVALEDGFWAGIKEDQYKMFLSKDNVECIDINNDGVMEIIIKVPVYFGCRISVLHYSNGKIEGKTDLMAIVRP